MPPPFACDPSISVQEKGQNLQKEILSCACFLHHTVNIAPLPTKAETGETLEDCKTVRDAGTGPAGRGIVLKEGMTSTVSDAEIRPVGQSTPGKDCVSESFPHRFCRLRA